MSQTASESAAKRYGAERVCEVLEQTISTFYDRQERVQKLAQGIKPGKRGPKPSVSDEELLDLIRHDLAASPFRGERHRKMGGGCTSGRDRGVSQGGAAAHQDRYRRPLSCSEGNSLTPGCK
jgi:hypothetical protein